MENGIITRLGNGFGWIKPDSGDSEKMFHVSELQGVAFDQLCAGDHLTFSMDKMGVFAINVKRAE